MFASLRLHFEFLASQRLGVSVIQHLFCMSDVIISVQGLGKNCRISHQGEKPRYTALRDVLAQQFAAPIQFLREPGRSKLEEGRTEAPIPQLRSPISDDSSLSAFCFPCFSFLALDTGFHPELTGTRKHFPERHPNLGRS